MPRSKKQYSSPYSSPKQQQDEKPLFFSEKFRKSDLQAVKELDKANLGWWVDVLEGMPLTYTFTVKWSDQNECFQCTVNIPLTAEGTGRKGLLIGRGSTKVGAMTVAAYWLKTVGVAEMFPADDVDEEALF